MSDIATAGGGLSGNDVVNLVNNLIPHLQQTQQSKEQPDTALSQALAELREATSNLSKPVEPPKATPEIKEEGPKNTMDEAKIASMFKDLQEQQQKQINQLQLDLKRSEILREYEVPKSFENDVRGQSVEEMQQAAKSAVERYNTMKTEAQQEVMNKFGIPTDSNPEAYQEYLKQQYQPTPMAEPETAEELAKQIDTLPEHLKQVVTKAMNVNTQVSQQQQPQAEPNQVGNGLTHPGAAGEPVGYNALNTVKQQNQGGNPAYGQQAAPNAGLTSDQIKGLDATSYPDSRQEAHNVARAALDKAI